MKNWLLTFGGNPARAAAIDADLVRRYGEPHRRYHTREHVRDLLALLGDDDWTLVAAAWFHDAIYDTHRNDNEALSAELARGALTELRFPDVETVVQIILATAKHDGTDLSATGLLFLDADLSILGAPPARYREYAAQIREEYAWVPEPQFREGRRAILERFLTRPRLYFTDAMRAQFEEQARANLREEIATLLKT
ncbi:MAG: metal-dependent phosphohydrolase [Acidobacteria bacterium]|nr:metal-dependent phosphohydrolase [Acidobacteriota bacterium]